VRVSVAALAHTLSRTFAAAVGQTSSNVPQTCAHVPCGFHSPDELRAASQAVVGSFDDDDFRNNVPPTDQVVDIVSQVRRYKEIPPFLEFIDSDSGQLGTRNAYPQTADSFFHYSGPCICAPFNGYQESCWRLFSNGI
jgi:hypothetical protein